MFSEILIYFGIFILAYTGVEIFRRWSRRLKILDVPNERSLHENPTPRGGGLIIVFISLFSYLFYALYHGKDIFWNYLTGAILIAFISFLDDLFSVPIIWRLAAQTAAALLIVCGVFTSGDWMPGEPAALKILKSIFIFFWILWLTNAYNFMDGIDGLAGMQAVTAGVGWVLAAALTDNPSVGFFAGVIACSSCGFLIQNWQPAKVFMGDVGSAFLGYSFAALPIMAASGSGNGSSLEWIFTGAGFLWLFIFDTFFTLCRRALKREKIWLPHRVHIYQRLVIYGFSHRAVAILYGVLSIIIGFFVLLALVNPIYKFWVPAISLSASVFLILLSVLVEKNIKKSGNFPGTLEKSDGTRGERGNLL